VPRRKSYSTAIEASYRRQPVRGGVGQAAQIPYGELVLARGKVRVYPRGVEGVPEPDVGGAQAFGVGWLERDGQLTFGSMHG
jgi:hypothetical protein